MQKGLGVFQAAGGEFEGGGHRSVRLAGICQKLRVSLPSKCIGYPLCTAAWGVCLEPQESEL